MRILLLNPPGKRIYIRDYFCSKTTKSNYLFHPVDLLGLSGTAAEFAKARGGELSVLDCMAERLSVDAAHAKIEAFRPDVVVSLVGSVSWDEDRAFLSEEHRRGRRVLAIGDVLHENAEDRMREELWIEAVIHVFANADLAHYLAGERELIEDMSVRRDDGTDPGEPTRLCRLEAKHRKGEFVLPRPRHELFPATGYHFSFAKNAPFATVLTDYGCPYPCTVCVIGTLGFQTRAVAEVLEEIDALRASGVRELFFMDQTFGVVRSRALELCRAFEERGDLSWTAYTRPDTGDDELLAAMKSAGCHTIMMGVESADDELLAAYEKGYRSSIILDAFRRARQFGLRTVGTFIIGLPEETKSSLEKTLELAVRMDMDFMSLNMAVPRFGTPFRKQALELGLASERDLVMDQGGADAFLPTSTLDRKTMLAMKKRMVRRFYMRPSYLWRRLTSVGSLFELRAQLREGWALFSRNI